LARKSPQEKKRLSLRKDRRNTYGENSKASRKAIPRHKKAQRRAARRIEKQVLSAGSHPEIDLGDAVNVRMGWAFRTKFRRSDVTDVANLIKYEGLQNIVLAGHSYAGSIITGVAEQMLPAVASIVFIDAFLPGNGDTMLSMTTEALRAASLEAKAKGDISRPIVPAAAFRVNEKDQAWVNSKLTPQPLGPSFTPIKYTGARDKVAKKTYIRAVDYPQPAFDKWLAQCKADPTWRTHGVTDCGHDIMVDKPDELTELLIGAA